MSALINLRNTVSGVTHTYTAKEAERILKHPRWKSVLVKVDTPKNEVLAPAHTVDEDGKRTPIKTDKKDED